MLPHAWLFRRDAGRSRRDFRWHAMMMMGAVVFSDFDDCSPLRWRPAIAEFYYHAHSRRARDTVAVRVDLADTDISSLDFAAITSRLSRCCRLLPFSAADLLGFHACSPKCTALPRRFYRRRHDHE